MASHYQRNHNGTFNILRRLQLEQNLLQFHELSSAVIIWRVSGNLSFQDIAGFVLEFPVNSHGSLALFKSCGWFYAFGDIVRGVLTLNFNHPRTEITWR